MNARKSEDDDFLVKYPATPGLDRLRKVSLTVDLSQDDVKALDTAIQDTLELVHDAGHIFSLFSYNAASGAIDPNDAVIQAIMRMSARAVRSMEDREFNALDRLDLSLRLARKAQGSAA